jgi:restriction system protein
MTSVWCVRAEFGSYTQAFVDGGYVAIGWMPGLDLGTLRSREGLYPLYKQVYPEDTSNIVIGQQVGQIARFLLEIQAGDYVITPASDTEWLHYGTVAAEPSYLHAAPDACPYRHRRRVEWAPQRLKRSDFSVPFQNTIRSSLTVFSVSQRDEFLAAVGGDTLPMRVEASRLLYQLDRAAYREAVRATRGLTTTTDDPAVEAAGGEDGVPLGG